MGSTWVLHGLCEPLHELSGFCTPSVSRKSKRSKAQSWRLWPMALCCLEATGFPGFQKWSWGYGVQKWRYQFDRKWLVYLLKKNWMILGVPPWLDGNLQSYTLSIFQESKKHRILRYHNLRKELRRSEVQPTPCVNKKTGFSLGVNCPGLENSQTNGIAGNW